jgi:hypothetical protein
LKRVCPAARIEHAARSAHEQARPVQSGHAVLVEVGHGLSPRPTGPKQGKPEPLDGGPIMERRTRRPGPGTVPALALALALLPGCSGDANTPSPDPTAGVETYFGTWTQNGTSGTQDAVKSLVIGADLSCAQTIEQYESTAKTTVTSVREVAATVTAVSVDENNPAYRTIFLAVHSVRVTPRTATQAADWNGAEYGGVTSWVQQDTRTFDADHPGFWEFGSVWLDHVAVSVKREGDLLNVNERGGFDGQDPPEDVYYLEP